MRKDYARFLSILKTNVKQNYILGLITFFCLLCWGNKIQIGDVPLYNRKDWGRTVNFPWSFSPLQLGLSTESIL